MYIQILKTLPGIYMTIDGSVNDGDILDHRLNTCAYISMTQVDDSVKLISITRNGFHIIKCFQYRTSYHPRVKGA